MYEPSLALPGLGVQVVSPVLVPRTLPWDWTDPVPTWALLLVGLLCGGCACLHLLGYVLHFCLLKFPICLPVGCPSVPFCFCLLAPCPHPSLPVECPLISVLSVTFSPALPLSALLCTCLPVSPLPGCDACLHLPVGCPSFSVLTYGASDCSAH